MQLKSSNGDREGSCGVVDNVLACDPLYTCETVAITEDSNGRTSKAKEIK